MTLANETLFPPPQFFDENMKCELINHFWPHLQLSADDLIQEHYSAFFKFVFKTLQSLCPHASDFAIQNFEGLYTMVKELRDDRTLSREMIKDRLRGQYLNFSDTAISRSMELAVRLWLGLNVCSKTLAVGPRNPRDSRLNWDQNEPLEKMAEAQFLEKIQRPVSTVYQLDDFFTAINLKNICRVDIRWTNNLADHLKVDGPKGRRVLSVYQHKICLINQRQDPQNAVIRRDVLDEAIRTLDLLFPFGDADTEQFLKQQGLPIFSLKLSQRPDNRDLNDFNYWKSNLSQLLNILHGPPETALQTLLDTRNLNQWVTLWIAIFGVFIITILFGILATVYTIKQYRLALISYEVSLKSFELSLALACQQATSPIPGFCD